MVAAHGGLARPRRAGHAAREELPRLLQDQSPPRADVRHLGLGCLPRRVRVEILPSAKTQGREHVERLSAPLCAEQPRGRRGRGGASQGRMGVRARLNRQIHLHRVALRLPGRPALPVRRCGAWVMCGAWAWEVWATPRGQGGMGVGCTERSCESCDAISRWWRARAPASTATNVRIRAAPVCVAMLTPRCVGRGCMPPEACAQRVCWRLAEVLPRRLGAWRGGMEPRCQSVKAAAKAAAALLVSRPVGSSERLTKGPLGMAE